jgi:two-component system sensor histidine kinase UhpB
MGANHGGARLEDSLRLVDEAIGNVRQMSQLLRPTILDDFGLEAGLRWLAEGFSTRTGIPVEFHSGFSGRLADQTETHLFRIAQEALTNVARHAEARGVSLSLEPAGAEIVLRIADDGRGMPPPAAHSPEIRRGLGLIGMRARARSAGGDIAIRSQPGRGVVIEVRVPAHDETHSRSAG